MEGVEGLALEEAEGLHGGGWMWFWVQCRGSKFGDSGLRSCLCLLMRVLR